MKTFLFALITFMTIHVGLAAQTSHVQGKKILIAYYSLRNGNTRIVAEEIQKNVGGDIFRIETVNNYPAEYRDVTDQAKREQESEFRPKLKKNVSGFNQYDVIFIGSPIWWGTVAPTVKTFLESNDFKGKTIVPFVTHGGSQLGSSVSDIRKLCPDSKVLDGLAVLGSNANNSSNDVIKWLNTIGITK